MTKTSAGLLMYRFKDGKPEVFLVHPGGPYHMNKEHWGMPKGELKDGEDPLLAAQREFTEETGFVAAGPFKELGSVARPGKTLHSWAFEGDNDPAKLVSNTCEVEWPPKSGTRITIPEVDRGAYYSLTEAKEKISEWQEALIDRLTEVLGKK